MKTMKIIASVVGLALTSICCGQILSQSELILSSNDTCFHMNLPSVHPLLVHERSSSGDQFDPTLLYRTHYNNATANTSDLEPWMTRPFNQEEDLAELEEELEVEDWMSSSWI